MVIEEEFIVYSLADLESELESGRMAFPIILSPGGDPAKVKRVCVFDGTSLGSAFYQVSRLSCSGRVFVKPLCITKVEL